MFLEAILPSCVVVLNRPRIVCRSLIEAPQSLTPAQRSFLGRSRLPLVPAAPRAKARLREHARRMMSLPWANTRSTLLSLLTSQIREAKREKKAEDHKR